MTRCGICNAPTLTGVICKLHWEELDRLLDQCVGVEADLDAAIGKRLKFGTVPRGSSAPSIPINPVAVDAKRALYGALRGALARIEPGVGELPLDSIIARLRAAGRLRGSWVAPVLLGELRWMVPDVLRVVDRPRRRLTVAVPCPACGGGPLAPVMGALKCRACSVVSSVWEVRNAG